MGLFSGGLIIRGSFALQKWLNLHLEGIFHLKMRDFASQNAVPEGMWIQGGGTELSCNSTKDSDLAIELNLYLSFHTMFLYGIMLW